MQYVKHYVKENKSQLLGIFRSMGNDEGQIQATKVFSFLQSAFDTIEIKFLRNGKSIFADDQNAQKMQVLIQEYYMQKNQGKQTKFYMYRVNFQFNEVIQIIKFWIDKDSTIQVAYKGIIQNSEPLRLAEKSSSQNQQIKQHDQQQKLDNQFMPQIKDIPAIIKKYKQQIAKYEDSIRTQKLNENQIKQYQDNINQLNTKIVFLQERLAKGLVKKEEEEEQKTKKNNSFQGILSKNSNLEKQFFSIKKTEQEGESGSVSPKKSVSPVKIQSTMKAIFQFYAKQLHFTGVKNSFQRIEHQTTRINYQKLVHFLKQYRIFPQSSKDQKKLHHIYVKCSSNTRDLTYQGFLSLIQKLAEIIIPSENQNKNKFELLKMKIIQQRLKNKILNNPFHSLQKEDFRIDKASLKYEFKLMPLNGKAPEQITTELESRRLMKQEVKQERQKAQLQKKIRYIKKLQSIDPFHPLVQKNRHLIRQRNVMQSEPIVSMDNIEMFRDKSFDVKQMFGIQIQQGLHRRDSYKQPDSPLRGNASNNNSYLIKNRVKQIEKIEVEKMKNLMSGIIERSNAKLQKMGISPTKKSSIY